MKNSSKLLKAFTLIELLIVIVIIGVLATSLIPRLTGIQDKAKITSIKVLLNQAYTQAQIYHMNNGGTYAGLCNDTTIQGILGSLGGSGHVACYVHPNTITTIDWGIATTFKSRHYLAGPQGVMVLDEGNVTGYHTWASAMNACEQQGKKLPSVSVMKALSNITAGVSLPANVGPGWAWTSTLDPATSNRAYCITVYDNVFGYGYISPYQKTTQTSVRCASVE